jgi:hypothetical protein
MNWESWGFWDWFGIVVAVLVLIFILRNLPDLFRYLRIRSM